jgi:hypothetical protein
MEFFIIMIAWFIISHILAELGPLVIAGLGAAIRFLFMAQWMAIIAILRALIWLTVQLVRLLVRAARLGGRCLAFAASVLFYLLQDWLRGAAGEAEADAAPDEEDLFEAALRLLGLPADYTRAALDATYKQAIRKAHPDTGGSVDQAQAVNAAREILLRRRGWA